MPKAKLAFCLFEFVPFGGMQRDLLRIARACLAREHQVDVYASLWKGQPPSDLKVSVLPAWGFSNHRRCESFARKLGEYLADKCYDAVVGFNKMPGLDVYYAADGCFAAKVSSRSFWYRCAGRCRTYLRLERSVFHKQAKTEILLISEREKVFYTDHYGTSEHRFHLLPPGISKDCLAPKNAAVVRAELRAELAIGLDHNVVLMVGSGFRTKGVDRAVRAISSLPPNILEKTILLVVGEDKTKSFRGLAKRLGVAKQLHFVGGREDVPRFLAAADLLLHPAYRENTGTVLIEAMAAGLPVLATDVCGYGHHVERAGAGKLVSSPFKQEKLNQLLTSMLTCEDKDQWKKNGLGYVASTDVFSLPDKAADIIEQVVSC
jgi:UDP-glucose:(heptosyl)LPS alpha-1,3-glucosyltransferase